MRLMLTPRSPNAFAIRSWVRGRPTELPEILAAMACASKDPIQIGRYRSASFSLRITRCCAVGIWIRMLSTETSMRFFILTAILPSGPWLSRFQSVQGGTHQGFLEFERGQGETGAGDPDRRPQTHLPGLLRPHADANVQRSGEERGLRLHVVA